MGTIKNFRTTADVTMNTRLKDGGIYIDWASLTDIRAWIYSDAQKALAGRVDVTIDQQDSTNAVLVYAGTKAQYPGVNRLIVQARYNGSLKTYDKPVFNFVPRTAEATGNVTIDEPETDVEIVVQDVSSSILDATILAALAAADRANEAAEEAEHMIDIHTGPAGADGKSAYELAVEEGYTGTEEEWLASLHGTDGTDGTDGKSAYQIAVDEGFVGTEEQWLASLKGEQGNPGSSQDYPFELVNNEETNDATKAHTAAGAKRLNDKIGQLEDKVDDNFSLPVATRSGYYNTNVSTGGTHSSSSTVVGVYMPCSPGDVFVIHGVAASSNYYRLYALYDSSQARVDRFANSGDYRTNPYVLTIPEGVAYVAINLSSYDATTDKILKRTSLADLSKRIQEVNDEIIDFHLDFVGQGNTLVTAASDARHRFHVVPGHKYRITVLQWDLTGVTTPDDYSAFIIRWVDAGGTYTTILNRTVAEGPVGVYDVIAPNGAVEIGIGGRATEGTYNFAYVADITDIIDISSNICENYPLRLSWGTISGDTGLIVSNLETNNRVCTEKFISCSSFRNGHISVLCPGYQIIAAFYDKLFAMLPRDSGWKASGYSFSVPDGAEYVKFSCRKEDNSVMPKYITVTISRIAFGGDARITYNSIDGSYPNEITGSINIRTTINIVSPTANDDDTVNIQATETLLTNYGLLRLPPSYMQKGKATPLIVFCHGYQPKYNATTTQISGTSPLNVDYLLAEGFAVMDVDGNPFSNTYSHAGAPMAADCYINAIKWVRDRYNIDEAVYLAGHSTGGLLADYMSRVCPFRAMALFAPASSVLLLFQLHPTDRDRIATYYGLSVPHPTWGNATILTNAEKAYLYSPENFAKIRKCSLLWGNVSGLDIDAISSAGSDFVSEPTDADKALYAAGAKMFTIPTKIFQGLADNRVFPGWTNIVVEMAKRAGGTIDYRKFADVGHQGDNGVTDCGSNTVTTIFGEQFQDAPTPLVEMVRFFRQF